MTTRTRSRVSVGTDVTDKRLRGQRRDHVQISGVAWRAAMHLAGQAAFDTITLHRVEWLTTDDLAAEIDASPQTLPRALEPLVEAGVVKRRWVTMVDKRGRRIEWRLR